MTDSKDLAPAITSPAPSPAVAEQATRPTVPQPKMRKPPPRVRAAIDALVTGQCRTKKAAAKLAGISREYFSRSFQNPAVVQYAMEASRRAASMGVMRAVAVLDELLDSRSERVRLETAKHLAGIGGIKPAADTNVSVNVGVAVAGYCIDLSEPGQPHKILGGAVVDATAEPIRGGPDHREQD
jgi:HEAT repeat protein